MKVEPNDENKDKKFIHEFLYERLTSWLLKSNMVESEYIEIVAHVHLSSLQKLGKIEQAEK